jgi:ketosteroid isomerase-like protein
MAMMPVAIAEYFEADRKGDTAAVANCFTADAVVRDEGHTYTGRDAIQEWRRAQARNTATPSSRSPLLTMAAARW